MKSLICNDIKITFRESGIASGSVMISLHNGGTDHSIWDPINEYFSTQYRIYAIDWPGFGQLDALKKPDWFPPTMVIWGKQNNVLPYRKGKAFMSRFKPDIELALEGGHQLMLENAKDSAHHIRKFMEKPAELSHRHHQFA